MISCVRGSKNSVGLLYEPSCESEVLILFGLLMPYLEEKFVIEQCSGSFPDCIARRDGEEVGIEFELLASNFFDHKHDENENLTKCHLIVCWKNDIKYKTETKNGKTLLNINGHEVEVMELNEVVEKLKNSGYFFILEGERPGLEEPNEERFFSQLKEKVSYEKYHLIRKLYEEFRQNDELEIKWSKGDKLFTMSFLVKRWGVAPIGVQADGYIFIGYTGNPAINPWELPEETKEELRRIFKHKEKSRWPTAPLNNQEDLDKIQKALNLMIKHSQYLKLIWSDKQT